MLPHSESLDVMDEYVAITRTPRVQQESVLFDVPVEDVERVHAERYPGAYSSSEPTPYEKSEMFGSEIEQDAAQDPRALFNDRQPHYALKREKPEHRNIIFLKAEGLSNIRIARALGITPVTVSNVLRQPWARKRLLEVIHSHGEDAVQTLLQGEAYDSVQRLVTERDNELARPSERISAANALLDRLLGKPSQPLNHTIKGQVDQLSDEDLESIIRQSGQGGSGGATVTTSSPSSP